MCYVGVSTLTGGYALRPANMTTKNQKHYKIKKKESKSSPNIKSNNNSAEKSVSVRCIF